jgi:hypothetical protein
MRKTRSDSTLGNLPDATQDAIFELCERTSLSEARAILSAPETEAGYNLQVSEAALSRWLSTRRHERWLDKIRDNKQRIADAETQLADTANDSYADTLILDGIKEYTLNLLATGQADVSDLTNLVKLIGESNKLTLAKQKLSIDERRVSLLEQKAAQADNAKSTIQSTLTAEEKEQRIKQIFGL